MKSKGKITRVLCCNCGTVIKASGGQTRKCKCGDITVFHYKQGFYDVAYKNNARYKVLTENRVGGRIGWLKDLKAGR